MKTIDEDIKTGQFKKVYLLYGEEDYLKKQYRDKLTKALMNEGDQMNLAKYEGKDVSVEEVISFADTMPFFADRRVVLVADSGFFKSSQEVLAEYITRIPETTCMVFVESEVDKRSKPYKAVTKAGCAVDFSMPDERMLTSWMMGRVKAAGKTMTREAWTEFFDRSSDSMDRS